MSSKMPAITSPPWSATTKRIVALMLVLFVLFLAWQVGAAIWRTMIITLLLAYILTPLVAFFEHQMAVLKNDEVRRTLAVLLVWVVVISILWLIIALIVPTLVAQLRELADELPNLIRRSQADLQETLSRPIKIGSFKFVPWDTLSRIFETQNGEAAGQDVSNAVQSVAVSLASPALNVVGGAVTLIFTTFVMLVMLFYLMKDGPYFVNSIVGAVPESYRGDVLRLLHELGHIWNAYLRGQLMLGIAVGFATYINALILGLPQPLVLGLLAGLLEFIPNLGPTLSSIPAILLALVTPSSTIAGLDAGLLYALVVGLSYVLIQQLEALFLVPRILGGNLELHPFVVLLGLLLGASLAGVLGMLLAAPTIASLRVLGRYLRAKLLDEELFPVMPTYSARPRGVVYRLIRYFLSKRFPVMPSSEGTERPLLTSSVYSDQHEEHEASEPVV